MRIASFNQEEPQDRLAVIAPQRFLCEKIPDVLDICDAA